MTMVWYPPIRICRSLVLVVVVGCLGCPGPAGPGAIPFEEDGALGSRCGEGHACADPWVCSLVEDEHVCTAACAPEEDTCPDDAECLAHRGDGFCLTANGLVGDLCVPEEGTGCRPGLICLGESGVGACTAVCDPTDLCPPADLVGDRVCVGLTDDAGFFCLRPCDDDEACVAGTVCTEVPETGWRVCFLP